MYVGIKPGVSLRSTPRPRDAARTPPDPSAGRNSSPGLLTRLGPPALLVGLTAVFFLPLVLHPTDVLYSDHSDLLAEHLPAKQFSVRSYQETGELPLWCPYRFAGSPAVADIQLAAFYPPHWLLYALAPEHLGAALSWLVAAHVLVAGLSAYAYARWRGLGRPAALVTAAGFMFAGRWMLHLLAAGHYVVVGLAWLPLVLLALERAVGQGSAAWAAAAGAAYSLVVLGTHPQYTFYAGLLVALWSLGAALGRNDRRRAVAVWAGCGALAVSVAAGLAAVQLLPTAEAAQLSSRASGVGALDALAGGMRALRDLVGPTLAGEPPQIAWEDRGGLTLLWLLAAVLAPLLVRGRVRYEAGVALGLALFAVGGAILVQELPGFRLFRQPTRMFVLLALPVGYLAGVTTEALFAGPPPTPEALRRCRAVLVRLSAAAALLSGGFALRLVLTEGKPVVPHVYWATLAVTVPAAWLLLRPGRRHARAWCVVLLLDLWALTLPLVATRPRAEVDAPPACVSYLADQARAGAGRWRVLDRYTGPGDNGTPLGAGAPQALRCGLEAVRGTAPLDCLRFKEYLQFLGGTDEPFRPIVNRFTYPTLPDIEITHKPLLDLLLGPGYLLQRSDERVDPAEWEAAFSDREPSAYDFIGGGRRTLPPYTVYRNVTGLPRAFVVHRVRPMPSRGDVLAALTAADLRREVLLEGDDTPAATDLPAAARTVEVTDYRPNRVTVAVGDGSDGWLVLADVWYPGWRCTVDGATVPVRRADFLYRAVLVPNGRHEVVFTFEPDSYRIGRQVSLAALGLTAAGLLVAVVRRSRVSPAAAAGG